jgi:hypothetical protein
MRLLMMRLGPLALVCCPFFLRLRTHVCVHIKLSTHARNAILHDNTPHGVMAEVMKVMLDTGFLLLADILKCQCPSTLTIESHYRNRKSSIESTF